VTARYSRAWHAAFRVLYAFLGLLDPLIRAWWRAYGLGNVVELEVPGRRTAQPRRVIVGLLTAGERWYVGHPNGDVDWTRNLAAAGRADVRLAGTLPVTVDATPLPDGEERESAIRATDQHPFPGNAIYGLARRHVRAAGVYFRLDPAGSVDSRGSVDTRGSLVPRHRLRR
jgi:deazaflavin-dependent oxidoreductase (nitroreductase family)